MNQQDEPKYRNVICSHSTESCPYQRDHCWMGEIDIRSLNADVPLTERLTCRKKKSKKVLCILGTA